jgi:hypothetical protein
VPIESQISELIPDGSGEVLWLGPQHAQALIDGLQLGEIPPRAIVLQGLLGRFENPGYVLRQILPVLGEDGVLVALVAPRLSPLSNGGFTRRELLALFVQAGYDVASCTAIHDPRLPLPPLTLAGAGGARPVDEVEEAASVAILVSARLPAPDAPEFSIVTTGDDDLPVLPGVEVIPARGPNRATAWNAGARKATGRWVAFLDAGDAPHPGWLEKLAATLQSSPRVGAAGTQALAFSGDPLPTHQLPSRITPTSSGVVDAVEGGGMLLQRSIFVAAGGFDPQLGPRHDGPDLCLRLRSRGFEIGGA